MSATILIVVSRLGLAALWALAALGKLRSWQRWLRTLEGIGARGRLLAPLAVAVPALELALAVGLLVSPVARAAALGSAALLGSFALVVAISLLWGREPECNCFGSAGSSPLSWGLVGRDLALATLALAIAWEPRFEIAPLLLVGAAAVALIAVLGWLCFALLRRHGQALARIDALEAGAAPGLRPAPPVGSAAPAFLVHDLAGDPVSSTDLLAGARTLLLVFVDPDCGPCRVLLPKLARWGAEPGRPRIAVIGSGAVDALAAAAAEAGLTEALVQEEREVATAYGIAGTPAAVLVSARGMVASSLALGTAAVEALVEFSGDGIAPPRPDGARPPTAAPALRPAPVLAATAVAGTAAAVAATGAAAAAGDPDLAAIKARLEAAKPVINADFASFEAAFAKVASSRRRQPPLAKLRAPLATQRAHAVALQGELAAINASSPEAQAVREAAVRSVGFEIQAIDEFEQLLTLTGKKERKRAQQRMRGFFEQARVAGYYANVGLGCTGEQC
ncbi:MAG: redoxin domain-containing protein [Actinobacteria bacterium]|nr:redoxin domain-containing protein [Actinomycetota bacterium]